MNQRSSPNRARQIALVLGPPLALVGVLLLYIAFSDGTAPTSSPTPTPRTPAPTATATPQSTQTPAPTTDPIGGEPTPLAWCGTAPRGYTEVCVMPFPSGLMGSLPTCYASGATPGAACRWVAMGAQKPTPTVPNGSFSLGSDAAGAEHGRSYSDPDPDGRAGVRGSADRRG